MRILTVLTYYRPHTSGLTIYAERLARALAQRGHQVTVFTTQYQRDLPAEEVLQGVRVVRAPVLLRFSKAVFSPTFGVLANRLVKEHDVVHLHLPQLDAPGIALRGKLYRKPVVMTYHCDITLPDHPLNFILNPGINLLHNLAAMLADRIVTYTQDYADNSTYLSRYRSKLQVIPPPVELPEVLNGTVEAFAGRHRIDHRRPVIGMAARLATEKGVEVLLEALPLILDSYPHALVLFAGQYENVLGEAGYYDRLMPTIRKYQDQGHWKFLGVLSPAEMAAFYPNLDVLVVPSLNSTEAFGLVQIEAMMNGVPCVASALPGVRQPVLNTGMGKVIPIGDSNALATAILEIMDRPEQYRKDPGAIARVYTPGAIAAVYESLFEDLLKRSRR
jgi:glycosyltransferase involved in cell wall biosynthesis